MTTNPGRRVIEPEGNNPFRSFRFAGGIAVVVIVIVVLLAALALASPFYYLFKQVREDQVGVRIRGGQIVGVVPPGIYSDFGLYVRMDTYSTQEYKFTATDPEVITKDTQRIGVTVSGSVFRPSIADEARVRALWTQYRSLYINDDALQLKMNDLSNQAMKVCVGDRAFNDAVIGSDRDALRTCIDDELNKLASAYGLDIRNLVVPNVALQAEAQAKLDAITQSRLDTEKAVQDEKKAIAQGKAQQAEQEAAIRVEQSKKQEETRQQTVLAQLEQQRLEAQKSVIEASKSNDLLTAQKDLEISRARAAAAEQQAKADLANQTAQAQLYQNNPNYYAYMMAQTNASAIKETDKVIFAPLGQFPNIVMGSGVLPTFNVAPQSPTPTTPTPTTTTP
jgi:hypothetical protein